MYLSAFGVYNLVFYTLKYAVKTGNSAVKSRFIDNIGLETDKLLEIHEKTNTKLCIKITRLTIFFKTKYLQA